MFSKGTDPDHSHVRCQPRPALDHCSAHVSCPIPSKMCSPLASRARSLEAARGPRVAGVKHSALTAASSECLPDILRMTLS